MVFRWEKQFESLQNEKNTSLDILEQIKTFSNMMPNLYWTFSSSNSTASNYYFYFDKTELLVCYPLIYFHKIDLINAIMNFTNNPVWCTDDKGDVHLIYKLKCRDFYSNIQKSKTDIFDYNYNKEINRTIFVTEFYYQSGKEGGNVYTVCIQFNYPINGQDAYACADKSNWFAI